MESNNSREIFGSIQTAKKVGISIRQLYHWVDTLRIVSPRIKKHGIRQFRHFTSQDLAVLVSVRQFVERGYTLRAAAEIVKGKRSHYEKNRVD